mmetsp:Transcript_12266/g.16054  ORF Transcript_12266/g.16054 Transcript_12266/m.16054 type:complete len:260 (+) Transcript_12266:109-888(+)
MSEAIKNFESYQAKAESGDATAQFDLGYCYCDGHGVDENKRLAFEWFQKSAEQGNANAQCMLATCYDFGFGTNRNRILGAEWYKRSAVQGHALAQWRLGVCYRDGRGVGRNLRLAVEWSHKAQAQGSLPAKKILDELFIELLNGAGRGNIPAQKTLIYCYQNGIGVKKSPLLASAWIERVNEAKRRQEQEDDYHPHHTVHYRAMPQRIKQGNYWFSVSRRRKVAKAVEFDHAISNALITESFSFSAHSELVENLEGTLC